MTPAERLAHEQQAFNAEMAAIDLQIGELLLRKERKVAAMNKVISTLWPKVPEQRSSDV